MTNADRIRQMSDEQLADLWNKNFHDCLKCPLKRYCIDLKYGYLRCEEVVKMWLESEVNTCESSKTQTE